MGSREVSTVILSWNDGALLDRAVASTRTFTGDLELVVVDNGSSPPVVVEGDVRLIRNATNRGVAAGRNIGVRASSGEYVCLLDSDAELLPGSLERLVARLDHHADVGLVAPTFVDQAPEASAGAAPTLVRKVRRVLGRTDRYAALARNTDDVEWDVDFAIGACQVFRRAAFDQVGGLDESYFYGPEDADFCLRLRRAGWRVLQVADAPVIHPPRRRNRRLLTRRGLRHAWAVSRFLVRHRGFARKVSRASG
jgi:GT2 family glycosyltransferase